MVKCPENSPNLWKDPIEPSVTAVSGANDIIWYNSHVLLPVNVRWARPLNPRPSRAPAPEQTANAIQTSCSSTAECLFRDISAIIPLQWLALCSDGGRAVLAQTGGVPEDLLHRLKAAASLSQLGWLDDVLWLPAEDTVPAVALQPASPVPSLDQAVQAARLALRAYTYKEQSQESERARRRLEIAEERRSRQVAALLQIGQAVHRLALDDLLHLVCQLATEVMEAQACSLMLKDASEELVIKAHHGLTGEVVRSTHLPRGQGLAWHVMDSGRPILLNESPAEQIGDLSTATRSDIQSSMCVPLRSQEGESIGVLSVRRMVPADRFQDDDLDLFTVFANQVGLFVSNAGLYDRLQRRVQEMSTVNRLTAAINATLDLEYVLSQIADCLIEVMAFDRCVVYLVDHRSQCLEARSARGFGDTTRYPQQIRMPEGVVGLAAREQIAILAEGQHIDTASPVRKGDSAEQSSLVAAPIVVRRKTIGVIVADNHNTTRPVDSSQVELLSSFVNHAGLAIENSSLYEAMEQKYSELNALYELSRTIGSAYGLENAVDLLLEVALKAVPDSAAAFALVDEREDRARLYAVRDEARLCSHGWKCLENPAAAPLLEKLRDPLLLSAASSTADSRREKAFRFFSERDLSLLLIPLIVDGAAVGVLALARPESVSFVPNDTKLLSIIASHASVVIKNAAAYERNVHERVLEMSALYELSQRISSAGSLDQALDSIIGIVSDLVDCDECGIWILDPEKDRLDLRASSQGAEDVRERGSGWDSELAEWIIRERKAVVLPDVRQDDRLRGRRLDGSAVRSLMGIPLMVQGEVVGVMSVHSYSPGRYNDDQVRTLTVIASQAASIYRGLEALTALTSYTDNILTSVPAGVATLDAAGTIVSWNRAASEILQVPEADALGHDFLDLLGRFNCDDQERRNLASTISGVVTGGRPESGVSLSIQGLHADDLHLMLGVSRLKDPEEQPLGVVIVFEDISHQVRMQNEVRRMGELAAIGQLAASIAHELRNPLSSIKGAAQFLQTETEDPSIREFLEIILEEVDGLNRIASEFLDFARPLRIEATEVSFSEVFHKQASLLQTQLQEADISIELDIHEHLPLVRADQKQIEQVLLNLILNSIQATPAGGCIKLTACMSRRWPGCVELSLADNGCGIPADRLEKVFIPFYTTKVKGTGLGLPVVQKIVQNHQGHLQVESREGEGTTFSIHLPVAGPAPPLLGEMPDSAPDLLERT